MTAPLRIVTLKGFWCLGCQERIFAEHGHYLLMDIAVHRSPCQQLSSNSLDCLRRAAVNTSYVERRHLATWLQESVEKTLRLWVALHHSRTKTLKRKYTICYRSSGLFKREVFVFGFLMPTDLGRESVRFWLNQGIHREWSRNLLVTWRW